MLKSLSPSLVILPLFCCLIVDDSDSEDDNDDSDDNDDDDDSDDSDSDSDDNDDNTFPWHNSIWICSCSLSIQLE